MPFGIKFMFGFQFRFGFGFFSSSKEYDDTDNFLFTMNQTEFYLVRNQEEIFTTDIFFPIWKETKL